MDELFEVSFSTFEEVQIETKVKPLCGKCRRYMKYINIRPPRLYCNICEDTYRLPTFKIHGGKIRQHGDFTCPIDGFGLLVVSTGGNGSKSYILCPNCYNHPTLEGMKEGMGCNQCPHEECKFGFKKHQVTDCEKCDAGGVMILDHLGTELNCNICNNTVVLPKAKRITVLDEECEETGDNLLQFEFDNNQPQQPSELLPLLNKAEKTTIIKASFRVHPVISELINKLNGRQGGGGGRGRGGRGRGRRRGGRGRRK
eukprot:TRINITY_DN729_c0_g1_i5.p1 TRINITY_DN729_c0_g1~~TRINITY_DN729_c0_g1_i5.p1  ORF type:complete len:256 (+),score=72.00 TRINITY_DN729_c0_g1_i5:173-940(+)